MAQDDMDNESTSADLSPAKQKLYELIRSRRQSEKAASEAVTIERADRSGPLPLSFSQQRMWFVDYMAPGNPAYNVPGALHLSGELSPGALEASLNRVVERHETLRTRFVASGGEPRQVIVKSLRLHLPVVDVRRVPEAERQHLVERFAVEDNQRPYDLAKGPLLRAFLVRLADHEHVLLLNMHHIIADNWSVALFVQETAELYEAAVAGRPPVVPELPFQYVDFALWQRRQLAGEALTSQLDYWLEVLGGALPVLELPTDRPRPALQTFRGARHYVDVSAPVTAALRALARRQEATPFVVGLTVFQLLLHRYTGQADLPVGTTAAGRRHSGQEPLLGLFMNLLVLRGDLSGEPTGREVLRRLHETTVGALGHQDVPFERVVDKLHVERDLSRSPVFQFQFNMQPASAQSMERAGVVMTPIYVDSGTARFDMEMILWDYEGGLKGYLEYNLDLFDPTTMDRLGGSFRQILRRLLRDPDAGVPSLVGLSDAESHQLLAEHNDTRSPALAEPSILPRIAAQAARDGDAAAVVFEGESLSYGELDRRANQLAHLLRGRGVGEGAVVGVAMERCPQLVVSLLGVLRSGAAYLPLAPGDPPERRRFLAEDAGVALLLRESPDLPDAGVPVVVLDGGYSALDGVDETPPSFSADAASAAYVIYTSGSTGKPKGVVSTHGGLANRLLWMQEAYGLGPDDRVLQKTSFTFDVSVWEFFWPLMTGAALVLARPGGQGDPPYLAGLISEQKVTTLHFVPSMLRVFLQAPEAAQCRGLRRVIVSGEALPADLARRFAEILPGVELWNLYGPTEASIDVTSWPFLPAASRFGEVTVPIGRPIANTAIHVLDRKLRPAPLGVPGELLIGGAGLARGYLGRGALTAERFVPDPWGDGQRLYRTGDLVRRLASGEIEFLERLDHQIKVRGFRIELGEIESHLLEHPAVAEAVVVAVPHASGSLRLLACFVPAADAGDTVAPEARPAMITVEEVRSWLRERLPDYMVPSLITTLGTLPRTASGKVDRKAVARHAGEGAAAPAAQPSLGPSRAGGAPYQHSETERAIAEVWKEVLGVESVGIDENFFDVGGDSLLLAQVHGKLRGVLGVELPTTTLFRYTTIRTLTEHLRQESGSEDDDRQGRERARIRSRHARQGDGDVAILSAAVRLPGARTTEEYWQSLCDGVESITFFDVEDCLAAGADPELVRHPDYVRAEALIDDVELFDAAFFGMTPREAELTDPQQRFLLELGWEALERAGYGSTVGRGAVGVYVGAALSSYLFNNLGHFRAATVMTDFHTRIMLFTGNDKDFHAQKLSYLLKLAGPSVNVQTACSSALVAVHLGMQSLLAGECDMALAGGVQIRVPQKIGYLYQEDGLPSPDGHCRPFDAKATGTLHSNGAGLVVLKRLEDALADRDPILAVIKGSAVNNDADAKVGFTAPSLEGIARVTAEALEVSGVDPATLGFLEAHGTGTDLGDTLEIDALTRVFRAHTQEREYCYVGSVKGNLGHLDTAAGIASLAKAALVLRHGRIPPIVNLEEPNPNIPFATSPFRVNSKAVDFPVLGDTPRRAAVNVFAIGGTNVHVVLEEAPPLPACDPGVPWQLLVLSARTTTALHDLRSHLRAHMEEHPDLDLADVAYTLQVGRSAFPVRQALLCRDREEALEALGQAASERIWNGFQTSRRPVVFLFSAEAPAAERVRELYAAEDGFRRRLDACLEALPNAPDVERLCREGGGALAFAAQHALAGLWTDWGVEPEAFFGVGAGQAVADCLGGDLSLADGFARAAGTEAAEDPDDEALGKLCGKPEQILLELGSGRLAGLVEDHADYSYEQLVLTLEEGLPARAALLAVLGQAWSVGEDVDWPALHPGPRRRLSLPYYPFERQRFWVEPQREEESSAAPRRRRKAGELLYVPTWQGRPLSSAELPGPAQGECSLVLGDSSSLCAEVRRRLEASGAPVVHVEAGDAFRQAGPGAYVLRPSQEEDYHALVEALAAEGLRPARVLHLWSLSAETADAEDKVFWSQVYLARSLSSPPIPPEGARGSAEAVLGVVTEGLQEIGGEEDPDWERALALAPVRVLPWEFPKLRAWCADVLVPAPGSRAETQLAGDLVREFGGDSSDVVYRRGQRYVRSFEPLELAADDAQLRDGGVYLVTDGSAGFGLELAVLLAQAVRAKLALVSSVELPPREAWTAWLEEHPDDASSARIRRLLSIEELGSEVLTLSADVTDHGQLKAALAACRERFGKLDGVVHAPAEGGAEATLSPVSELDPAGFARRLGPRVHGAVALTEVLEETGEEPSFVLLLTALSSAFGAPGVLADAAADDALERIGRRFERRSGILCRSVDWDESARLDAAAGAALLSRLVSPRSLPRITVSATDPEARRESLQPAKAESSGGGAPRPALETPYVAPSDEIEEAVCAIWEELFGIRGIGVDDNFFELGGHSLLATQLVHRLRDAFGVDLLLREALEQATIRQLALTVTARRLTASGDQDLEQLLEHLEGMSDEEALEISENT